MDQIAQWRPIEPAAPDPHSNEPKASTLDDAAGQWRVLLLAAVGAGVLVAAGVALWATTPQPQISLQPSGGPDTLAVVGAGASPVGAAAAPAATAVRELVVDVEGAVERPGLHRLGGGSRVGDAIIAAGGYNTQVDLDAAAQILNLAQPLSDGDKIHVPARGEQVAAPAMPTAAAPANTVGGGLIDINVATDSELDTLPGIGPVTAGKIIAARQEAPFASVDELLGRSVVGPATFEKIRELVTVTP